MAQLTQSQLKERLHYDPLTGIFTRRFTQGGDVAGTPAGGLHHSGYIHVRVMGKKYGAHRLAWLYVYGVWPPLFIDHINEIKNDNRIENLRPASASENRQNISKPPSNNTSGYKGVYLHRPGKFTAGIKKDGVFRYLGTFNNKEDAYAARKAAELDVHPFRAT